MKNFNQMTETQMSKTNGGLLDFLCIVAVTVIAAGLGAGVGAAAGTKNNK